MPRLLPAQPTTRTAVVEDCHEDEMKDKALHLLKVAGVCFFVGAASYTAVILFSLAIGAR